ncbi:MAG TPA: M20 family metallo-hydrolase [Candidatus Bathyarchaeia archaeon]
MPTEAIFHQIERQKPEMVDALIKLIRVPAVAPENGGDGETLKSETLMKLLENIGFDSIERFDIEDSRVTSGKRPNIVAVCQSDSDAEKLWIVTHLDVVPAGEEKLWTVTNSFEPLVRDGKVYGRGSEDNGQSLVASLYAVKAIKSLGIKPMRSVALAFVSDEEQGSKFGIQQLIARGLFGKKDLIVVPDGGRPDGSFIEIAEKSLLWFRIRTIGKQAHGSLPNVGLNANRIAMQVALALDQRLHNKFSLQDDFFDVPYSTFEPTKREKNVEALNIVPGEDVSYFDCRILPKYDLDEVLDEINKVLSEFEVKTGAKIKLELLMKQASPKPMVGSEEVVNLLRKALKEARGFDARVGGIGGGSCAAFFREAGIPAIVWSTVDEVMHQPNEYTIIENMVSDAKVYALMMLL